MCYLDVLIWKLFRIIGEKNSLQYETSLIKILNDINFYSAAEQMLAAQDLGLLHNIEDTKVTLDEYASDLNLVLDDDG